MWPATYTVAVTAPDDRLHGGPLRIGPRAVLVPVKAFSQAKRRLHLALSEPERAELARAMADRVVSAAHPLPVVVVCDDNEVAEWARARRALVVWEPGRARNGAEAERLGLPTRVLDRPDLAWDIDEPGDVIPVAVLGPSGP